MTQELCPLEEAVGFSVQGPMYLKRLDLLPFGGGNKVPRFEAWFAQHPQVQRVVILSDPGSHSMTTLSRLLERHSANAVFLETQRSLNPYTALARTRYLANPSVSVLQGSLARQILWHQYFGLKANNTGVLGWGGQVAGVEHCYDSLFEECRHQLGEKSEEPRWHLFPVASGTMVDSFFAFCERTAWRHQRIWGLLTGPLISQTVLRWKYFHDQRIHLTATQPLAYDHYLAEAKMFLSKTGVTLDPLHSIHGALALQRGLPRWENHELGTGGLVFWITCPHVEALVT